MIYLYYTFILHMNSSPGSLRSNLYLFRVVFCDLILNSIYFPYHVVYLMYSINKDINMYMKYLPNITGRHKLK